MGRTGSGFFNTSAITYRLTPTVTPDNWTAPMKGNYKASFISPLLAEYLTPIYTRKKEEKIKKAQLEQAYFDSVRAKAIYNRSVEVSRRKQSGGVFNSPLPEVPKAKRLHNLSRQNEQPIEDRVYKLCKIDLRPRGIEEYESSLSLPASEYKGPRVIGNYTIEDIGPLFRLINDLYPSVSSENQLNYFIKQATERAQQLNSEIKDGEDRKKAYVLCPNFHNMFFTPSPGPIIDSETGNMSMDYRNYSFMLSGDFNPEQASEINYASYLIKKLMKIKK